MRLDKLLTELGTGSRSEVKKIYPIRACHGQRGSCKETGTESG